MSGEYEVLIEAMRGVVESAYMGKMPIRRIRAALHETDLMLEHLAALELAEQHIATLKPKEEETHL